MRGRAGTGRATVAAALEGTGVTITGRDHADVTVVVVAEALKPEDRAMLAGPGGPVLTVLNKADLSGTRDGGPLETARRRAAHFRALTGVPTVPMSALLARATLDDELTCALRTLVTEAADFTSADAFTTTPHQIPPAVRARLLATLDRFGIAHAVLALSRGADATALPAVLREISGVDRVRAEIDVAAAPVRYRRVREAITRLQAVAAMSDDARIAEFLVADGTVLALTGAATEVVRAAGVVVDDHDESRDHLRRALYWRRYSQGPVNGLHRDCGADIARGALKLLGRSR